MNIFNRKFKTTIFGILTFSLVLCLPADLLAGQQVKREYWPTGGWKASSPEMQGMDPAKLMIAVEFIDNRLPDALSLLVIKNGYLVFEKYFWDGSAERVAAVHSVTKSVTSALAKIGFLYLNNGFWNGQSIVPEQWVKESTRPQLFASEIYGTNHYGYQWWIKDIDGCHSYRAQGRRGQFIVVVPELDLVMVVTSETEQPHPPTSVHYLPLFDLIVRAVKRDRPVETVWQSIAKIASQLLSNSQKSPAPSPSQSLELS